MTRMSLFAAGLFLLAVFSLAACSSSSDSGQQNGSFRLGSGTQLVTDLIAGAGQGWPASGEDIGSVTVSDDGTNLTVTFQTDGAWTMEGVQLYVGDTGPAGTNPGSFPFKGEAAGGTSYSFTLPIVGNYPPHGNDDPVPYDWTGDNLYLAAHAEASITTEGSSAFCEGSFESMGIYYGNNDILVGSLDFSIEGNNLVVTASVDSPWTMTETQLYVGYAPPTSHAPGSWPYIHSPLPSGTTTDSFTIPLDQIYDSQDGTPSMEALCEDLTELYVAFHATVTNGTQSESSTAWNPDCRTKFIVGNKPHWKSYCSFILPGCCETGGETQEETAWGLDDDGDEISQNEPGWFENFFNDPTQKWGWVFRYQQ